MGGGRGAYLLMDLLGTGEWPADGSVGHGDGLTTQRACRSGLSVSTPAAVKHREWSTSVAGASLECRRYHRDCSRTRPLCTLRLARCVGTLGEVGQARAVCPRLTFGRCDVANRWWEKRRCGCGCGRGRTPRRPRSGLAGPGSGEPKSSSRLAREASAPAAALGRRGEDSGSGASERSYERALAPPSRRACFIATHRDIAPGLLRAGPLRRRGRSGQVSGWLVGWWSAQDFVGAMATFDYENPTFEEEDGKKSGKKRGSGKLSVEVGSPTSLSTAQATFDRLPGSNGSPTSASSFMQEAFKGQVRELIVHGIGSEHRAAAEGKGGNWEEDQVRTAQTWTIQVSQIRSPTLSVSSSCKSRVMLAPRLT